jgi:hypothetical protein
MILNVFSVLLFFMDAVSLVLMVWGTVAAIKLLAGSRDIGIEDGRESLERNSYLVLLIACVVLLIRLIAWPFFYLVLWSFVPEITGAMCIFGVTQVKPLLTNALEIMKPFSVFLFGGWLLIHNLDRKTKRSDLLRRKLLMLPVIGLIVIIECVMEMHLLAKVSPSITVSCCTTVTDLLSRPTRVLPSSILGEKYGLYLEISYWAAAGMMAGCMAVLLWVRRLETLKRRRLWLGLVAAGSVIVTPPLFILAMIETMAPRLMKLPFHHCLYCLWQYVPGSIPIFILFIIGTFSPAWAFALDLTARKGEAVVLLPAFLRKLLFTGFLSMVGSGLLLAILDLVIVRG